MNKIVSTCAGAAILALVAGPVMAEDFASAKIAARAEEPRLPALEMSEIEQALKFHRDVLIKVVNVAVQNYPQESLNAGETGLVVLAVDVNPDGSLAGVKALGRSSAPKRLIEAGIEAAKAAAPFYPYDVSLAVMFRHIELQVDYKMKK